MSKDNQQEEAKYIFHIDGDGSITPRALTRSSAVSEVPPGVYTLVYEEPSPMGGGKLFLRPESNFKLPERLYGNVNVEVDRFLRSYELNDKNLGVLLIGEQGSGKTLTLKALATKAGAMGFPVILVNRKIPGEILNWFFSTITQPCLVCFDEYDKQYSDEKDQRAILQLLDGVNTGTKKMYCLTANEEGNLSKYLTNRPSRIRYIRRFRRLELSTVVDYVQTNLPNCTEDHLRAFIHMALCDADRSNGMNFDSMAEYVREMKQFGGTLNETLELMSTTGLKTWSYMEVTGFENGENKYRALANGSHTGAYASADNWNITFSIRKQVPKAKQEGEEQQQEELEWKFEPVNLTSDNFKSFGDSHDLLVFEKDGVEFHLRYIDHSTSRKVESEVEKTGAGKSTLPEMLMFQMASRAAAKRSLVGESAITSTSGVNEPGPAAPSGTSSTLHLEPETSKGPDGHTYSVVVPVQIIEPDQPAAEGGAKPEPEPF